jgi:2-isopropylmalate synthase
LKDRRTYEIMRPEDIGLPSSTLVLGKHSGRHALRQRCEHLGFTLDKLALDRVYRAMIALADTQKTITDNDLIALVQAEHRTTADVPVAGYGRGV